MSIPDKNIFSFTGICNDEVENTRKNLFCIILPIYDESVIFMSRTWNLEYK